MRGLFGALVDGAEAKAQALDFLPGFMLARESKTGKTVNYKTALEVATALACARVLGEGIAQSPWKVFKRRPDRQGADEDAAHPLHRVLYRRPNGWQTSFEFREQRMLHLVFCGNAYAYKNVVGGRIVELIPLEPNQVEVTRQRDLSLTYVVRADDGSSRPVPAALMWHTRGPSWNGWMGLEAVRIAREAIGLSMALEESHALLHKNGAHPSGTYSVEGALTADQHKQLTAWIKDQVGGANRGAPLILDRGAKWLAQQMSGVDAQHVETRKHQVEEICRFFRVFPQMVGHSDKTATFASAEAFFAAHVMHSLAPWAERFDQSADVNLLSEREAATHFTKVNLRGLLRGAIKDEGEYFAKALGSGGGPAWLTQDEVRGFMDLNPMGGRAAELREPSNIGKPPKTQEEPEPPPAPDDEEDED